MEDGITYEIATTVTIDDRGEALVVGAILREVVASPSVVGIRGDLGVSTSKSTIGIDASGARGGAGWDGQAGVASGATSGA